MKRITSLLTILMVFALWWTASAQLSGIKTIPGTYATIELAINDLNVQGVGTGGVTFNVAANYTETLTNPLTLTATGTAGNTIIFQKDPGTSGANPKVIRTDAGTLATSTLGAQGDAVIIIDGGDFITFDKIDVAATDASAGIEYGYYLRRASVTDGCKNVTIKNSVITMTKGTSAFVAGIYSSNNDAASTVSSATGIALTSTGGRTENLTLTGNTIQNVFAGIILRGFNAPAPYDLYDQNMVVGTAGAGNNIQNFAGNSASASYGVYLIYQTSPTVSFNTINNVAGGGTNATSTLYGIFMSTSSAGGNFVANNNAITLGQGSTSGAHAIYIAPLCSSITANNNTFSYGAFASTTTSYLIYSSNNTGNITVDGNSTVGSIIKTGAGGFTGYYNFGTPTGGTVSINNNNFSNIILTGASAFYGIQHYTSNTSVMAITNNTISNITGGSSAVYGIYQGYGAAGSTVNGNNVFGMTTNGTGAMYGIYLGATTAPISLSVYNNKIYSLSGSGASAIYGIYNALGVLNSIYKNKIYEITGTNAASLVYGIYIAGGTTTNIYNNLIGDIRTPAANAALTIAGIWVNAGTINNIAYNTVYINASSTGALFGSTAFYAVTGLIVNLNNNILVNTSTPAGATGFTTAYRRSANTSFFTYGPSSNNNLFYAGTPGPNNLIFYDATTSIPTLEAYKAFVSPRDNASVTENPPFLSTAGANANYLHINTAVATQTEKGGAPIASITDDFDGNTRSATTPDIGADEFNGILLDITAPMMTYTPLLNTFSTAARTLTVNITDISGVPTTSPGWPDLYWRINSGSWNTATPASVSGGNYTFTFGAGAVTGDVVQYYVAAQDNVVPTPNVGTNPSAGAGGFGFNPPSASTPPTTPASYTIVASNPLAGDYTVGTTMFNQITGKNIYFQKVIRKVMKEVDVIVPPAREQTEKSPMANEKESTEVAPVEPDLVIVKKMTEVEEISWVPMENGTLYTGDLYVKKSENPQMNFPGGVMGVYATITAAVADLNLRGVSSAVNFLLTDANYTTGETFPITVNVSNEFLPTSVNKVTFKPNSGVTATISGAVASSLIFNIFTNYITFDGSNAGGTDRNLTITNTATTSPVVLRIGSIGVTPIRNVTVKNCNIINGATSSSAIVIYASDGNPGYFNNVTIQNNKIQTAYIGVYSNAIVSPGNGSGLLITGNEMNTAGAGVIRLVGVYVQGVDGPTVSNNNISNMSNANAESPKMIWFATGTNAGTISGNIISNNTSTNTGAYGLTGIYISTGIVPTFINVSGNTISNLTNSGTAGLFAGVMSFSYNTNLTNNTISNLTQNGTSALWGIVQSGANNSTISGNVVNGITAGTSGVPSGINIQGISSGVTLFNNKVSNISNTNASGYSVYGMTFSSSAAFTNITAYNNFIWNISSAGSASLISGNAYGIQLSSGIGYNLYHNSVNMATNQTLSTGQPACLLITSTIVTPGSVDIRNNIFSIPATVGTDRYAVICNANNTIFSNINNNDYYTSGPNIGSFGGVNRADLAAWQAATLQDANSISADPNFISSTDLHISPSSGTVSNKGYYLSSVTTDIDGDIRNNPPDIGADEYTYVPSAIVDPGNVTATAINSSQINLSFTPNASSNNVVIVWNLTGVFTQPQGTPPAIGSSFAGGTLLYNGLVSPQIHSGLTNPTTYYYKLFSFDGSYYSLGVGVNAITPCNAVTLPFTENFTGLAAGEKPACWTKSFAGNMNWGAVLSANAGGTSPEMRFGWSPLFTGVSLFQSPIINTTGLTKVAIKFKHFVDFYDISTFVGVKTSSDGNTWNTVWSISPTGNVGPEEKTIILTGGDVGSANFQFAFFFDGYSNNIDFWYIDDISAFVPIIGSLEGTVTSAGSKGPIAGAIVQSGSFSTTTNASGFYSIPEILAGNYNFTCSASGYITATAPVAIVEGETTTQNFTLTYPLIQINPTSITQILEPEQTGNQVLHISNIGGTAPLTWGATIAIPPSDNSVLPTAPVEFGEPYQMTNTNPSSEASPTTSKVKSEVTDATWDIRFSWSTHDSGEVGIETDGTNFYTSTWSLTGVFSKYTMAGAFIENFSIAGAGAIRDLAYDGQYFYGGATASTIYILDLANKSLVGTITVDAAVGGVRHIAYDPIFDGFWCGNWTTLYLVSRSGAILKTGPAVVSVYGSAYDGYSAGGPYLWLNAQVSVAGCGTSYDLVQAQQFKISTNALTGVNHCETDIPGYIPGNATTSTIAGGMCTSDRVIPGKLVLITNIQQAPNLIGGYELANTVPSWVSMDTYNGTVAPGATQNVRINFNSIGLTAPTTKTTTMTITHNALSQTDGTINIPVTLNVVWSAKPDAPSNPSPANNAVNVPLLPHLSWTNGDRTEEVMVVIKKEVGEDIIVIYSSPWFAGNSLDMATIGTVPPLEANKLHIWNVIARNSIGMTNSPEWKFTTAGFGSISGLVTDNSGKGPISGVTITASELRYSAITGADGTYYIPDVLTGSYTVTATHPDFYAVSPLIVNVANSTTATANFTLTPICLTPVNLTATNITSNGATIGWTSGASNWNVEYGFDGFTPGTGAGIFIPNITINPYHLSGLIPGKDYTCYVQSVCGGQMSEWSTPVNFSTPVPQQTVTLPLGWSGWSSYIAPAAKATFAGVVAPITADMAITQYFSNVYWPEYGINTMGDFSNAHGYVTKMNAQSALTLVGNVVASNITLNEGWNIIPVISTCNVAASELENIAGFIIAVEIAGNGVYYPAGEIYTLTQLVPGKAYYVKTSTAGMFTFPACGADGGYTNIKPVRNQNITNWNDVNYTGVSHTVVFDQNATSQLAQGDVIGAFTSNGLCAGMVMVDANTTALSLFANDISTTQVDGFADGELISFRVYRQSTGEEFTLDVTYNAQMPNSNGLFAVNGLSVVNNLTMSITGINGQSLSGLSIYPNPSNGVFTISLNGMDKNIDYVIMNAHGQQVVEGKLLNTQQIDLTAQPKGVYFIKFTSNSVLRIEKVVVK